MVFIFILDIGENVEPVELDFEFDFFLAIDIAFVRFDIYLDLVEYFDFIQVTIDHILGIHFVLRIVDDHD